MATWVAVQVVGGLTSLAAPMGTTLLCACTVSVLGTTGDASTLELPQLTWTVAGLGMCHQAARGFALELKETDT